MDAKYVFQTPDHMKQRITSFACLSPGRRLRTRGKYVPVCSTAAVAPGVAQASFSTSRSHLLLPSRDITTSMYVIPAADGRYEGSRTKVLFSTQASRRAVCANPAMLQPE